MFRKTTRSAFTLVELLVVVAIIGLLAVMLLPVLNRVQAASRATDCTNNLRQIGQGMALYLGVSQGRYPIAARKPSAGGLPSLVRVMAGRVDSEEVWHCPEDQTFVALEGLSYEWNSFLNGEVLQATTIYKLAKSNTAAVPIMGDYEKIHDQGRSKLVLFADGHVEELH